MRVLFINFNLLWDYNGWNLFTIRYLQIKLLIICWGSQNLSIANQHNLTKNILKYTLSYDIRAGKEVLTTVRKILLIVTVKIIFKFIGIFIDNNITSSTTKDHIAHWYWCIVHTTFLSDKFSILRKNTIFKTK